MILKLRRILGLDNKQEKVENYSELHKSLMDLNERIDEIAEDFTVKNENYKQLLKSKGLSDDIAKSVQTRHINFVEMHKKEIHEVLRKRKEIKSKCDKLLSDPEISKAVKEIEFFDNLKSKYKSKEIGLREYDLILKAKTGKTKYSDILVYNKDGQLLLVQRDQHDNNGSKWGVPGGHVDAGEEFLEAAQRELFEETGIWVDELEEVAVYDKEGKEIHYFKVDLEEETQVVVQNTEGQDYKWVNFSELEDIEMPFNMKENLYKVLGFEEKEVKIIKAVNSGQISRELGEELIEKARSGVYKDTPENRKLGRVGQKYGSKKEQKNKEEIVSSFSYSKRDYIEAYPEDDSGSIEETINKFISNLTDKKSDRVGSQYYRTGKKINGKDAVIRVSDHSHSERNVLESEYILSIIVDSDASSSIRVEDNYSELVVSERNLDDALESVEDFFDDVEIKVKDSLEKSFPEETKEEYEAHESKEPPKREKEEKEHLLEMIQEHERLIKVISPFSDSSDAVKEELKIQKKELKEYKEKLKDIEEKGLKKVEEEEEDIEKARTGVYADTPENRRLKRVGKKYGKPSNQEEQKPGKGKKEDDKDSQPKQSIEEYAKNSSQEALENASKGKDEELRVAAKKELKRRETEENESDRPEEDVSGEAEKKTGEENPSSGKLDITENKYENGVTTITIGEESGSRVRGILSKDGKTFQIKSTFVSEEERGKGKAKSMYLQLIDNLKERGVTTVKSDVQVEALAGKIYDSLLREGIKVKRNEGAVLEKDSAGDFWWVPEDDSLSPFEIDLTKTKEDVPIS